MKQADFSLLEETWEWRRKYTHDAVTEELLRSMIGHVYDMEQVDNEGKPFGATVGVIGYEVDHLFNKKGEPATRYRINGDEGMSFLVFKGVKFTVVMEH